VIVFLVNKQTSIVRSCGSKIGAKPCYKTAGINHVRKLFIISYLNIDNLQ